mmetsp:Transcript_10738/g.16464  ORF Transcript_10738/g.16464 Transcript_10738/m.16464 type:complete len:316 (-) Transcript_10738:8-955(-)
MLIGLPSDLLYRILFQYSDGKCLSTLLLLCKDENNEFVRLVSRVTIDRLNCVFRMSQQCYSCEKVKKLVANTLKTMRNHGVKNIKMISLGLAVLDYFEKFASYDPGRKVIEFPIWMGFLSMPQDPPNRELVLFVKLLSPFLQLHLIGAIQPLSNATLRHDIIDLNYQNRNFRTAPPLGRIEIMQRERGGKLEQCEQQCVTRDELSIIVAKMNTQNEILAPRPSWYSRNHPFSPFLFTKSQAIINCPSFLKENLDPYSFKKGRVGNDSKSAFDRNSLFCQWHCTEVDEQVRSFEETIIALTHFMHRLDTLQSKHSW